MEIKKKNIYLGVGIVVGVGVVLWLSRSEMYKHFDYRTNALLLTLDKKFRTKVGKLLDKARKEGIQLRVISAYRDCDEQNRLYSKGRTLPGSKVTNAKCGQSAHNYGKAVDVVEFRDGQPLWENPRWVQIGRLGESVGLEWGGRWNGFVDRPHFQDLGGKTIGQLYRQYRESGQANV